MRYTEADRAAAVLMYEAAGGPEKKGAQAQVAKRLGIPAMTLGRWQRRLSNPPPNDIVNEKKFDFVAALDDLMIGLLGDMNDARQDAPLNQLATAYGIMFDKKQLLTGGPTESIDQRNATVIAIVNVDEGENL